MTRVIEAEQATEVAATPGVSRPRAWLALLACGFLLQVAWRVYLSWPLTGPIAHADEDGYLLGARVLAGQAGATLPPFSIMRPIGYPLMLTPAYWFADDPAHVYWGVHLINALLMALTFPLIYLLARRLFDLDRLWSAGLAFVLATLPSMVFFSQFALTDALLPAIVMALMLTVHGMFTATGRRAVWYAVGAGAVAAYGANTHVRGQVMLVVLVAVVALGAWRRWIPWASAVACFGTAAVVFILGYLGNKWLEDQLFENGAFSADGRVLERLTSLKGVVRIICNGSGQVWHLSTSTYGLAALGLAAAAWALWRREGPRPTRIVYGMTLAITIGIALATAAGTPNEGRVNNHVYGRYIAMFAAFWALVGIVALARAGRRRAAWLVADGSAITLLSLGAVLAYAGRRMRHESYVNFDSPELSFLAGDFRALHWFQMTGYAIVFMAIFAALLVGCLPLDRARQGIRSRIAVATMAATMVLNLVAMVVITDEISRAWHDSQYRPAIPRLVADAGVRPGDTIIEDSTIHWWINMRHQREVYWQHMPSFDPAKGAPPTPAMFVVATAAKPTDWDGNRYGYTLVLRFAEGGYGTWAVWRRA
jgi:4-amino-4-deoxy-L-arabinose transferase-like glycosyltransferase